MAQDVLVKVRGSRHTPGEAEETVELVTGGKYDCRDGRHYICYEEVQEGADGVVRSLIKADESCVEVTRRGLTNTHMVFQKERKNEAFYETPFGSLTLGVAATDISLQDRGEGLDLRVAYAMDMNTMFLGDYVINIQIQYV